MSASGKMHGKNVQVNLENKTSRVTSSRVNMSANAMASNAASFDISAEPIAV